MRKEVVITLATRFVMLVGGLGASIVTARALGPTGRGDYAFVATLSGTIVQLSNLGLQSSNTYLVARNHDRLGALLGNSLCVSLVVGGGVAATVVAVVTELNIFPHTPSADLWLAVALAPPCLFFLLGANLLVGIGRIRLFNVYEGQSAFVVLVLLAAASALGLGVRGFLGASAVAWWLIGVALLLTLTRLSERRFGFDRDVFGEGVTYAAKAYVVTLLGYLLLRSNYFLLARLAGTTQVGYFSVATQITDVLTLIPTSAAIVLFPNLMRDRNATWNTTLRSAYAVGAGLAVLCSIVGIFAPIFIRVAFGATYEPAVGALRWMLPGVFALGITAVISQHLAAIGMPRRLIVVWGAGLAASVALGRILIPRYGLSGAAICYTASSSLVLVLVAALAHRLREVRPA